MKAARKPADEAYRLEALRALPLLGGGPEKDFDTIVQLGRDLFDVPICLVSVVEEERQLFKARVGLEVAETSRTVSFCAHAILQRDVFIVLDAARDERFRDNPLVTGEPHIRFYAGSPIWLPSGYPVGTVCIISPEPRDTFSLKDATRLTRLADLAVTVIGAAALSGLLERERAVRERYEAALHHASEPLALARDDGVVQDGNAAFAALADRLEALGWHSDDGLRIPHALRHAADGRGADDAAPAEDIGGHALAVARAGAGYLVAGRRKTSD